MGFFNWNSNDSTATNTAQTEVPPALFLSTQNCNTLEIPQARSESNENVVAKHGTLSFSNIFHDLIGQPQFNMIAAVEANPPEQPNCIRQASDMGATSQPTDALPNSNQPGGNGDHMPMLINQPGGNSDMPLIIDQPGDDLLQPLSHQPGGENRRLDCAKVVSEELNQIDQHIGVTANLDAMRHELTKNGWDQVAQDSSQFEPQQLQPGDVITATRLPGMPGHAAIYLGGSMIYNNNSDAGEPEVESVDKFMDKQYNADGSFNKDGYSNINVYRNRSESFRQNEINKLADLSE